MTAVNDTTYLPRLEECLDGKTTVLYAPALQEPNCYPDIPLNILS